MSQLSVPCPVPVRMVVESRAQHRCPFKDEVDYGMVRVEWTTSGGESLELHALAELVGARAGEEVSHEQWTADLATALAAKANVAGLKVTSMWSTAGATVTVRVPAAEGGDSP